MSRGKKLQEMEVKTQQSKSAVNANAKPGDPNAKVNHRWYTTNLRRSRAQLQRTISQITTQQN